MHDVWASKLTRKNLSKKPYNLFSMHQLYKVLETKMSLSIISFHDYRKSGIVKSYHTFHDYRKAGSLKSLVTFSDPAFAIIMKFFSLSRLYFRCSWHLIPYSKFFQIKKSVLIALTFFFFFSFVIAKIVFQKQDFLRIISSLCTVQSKRQGDALSVCLFCIRMK